MRISLILAAAVLAAIGGGGAASAQKTQGPKAPGPSTVEIVLADFSFAPRSLALAAGTPVTLHFVNRGSGGHNFAAPEFFRAAKVDPAGAAAIRDGRIELEKGASTDVTLTPAAGTYPVKCTHFLHATMGMTGEILVR